MLNLHVIFAVDRAGLVGEDGETHHGVFDVGFLRQAPGMTVLAPATFEELQTMLQWAVEEHDGPVAIRYPRGGACGEYSPAWQIKSSALHACAVTRHKSGEDITLIAYGALTEAVLEAAEILDRQGIHATVLRLLSLSPLPVNQILEYLSVNSHVIVIEETCQGSGIRESLAWDLQHIKKEIRVDGIDLGHRYVTHGALKTLRQHYGLSPQAIADFVQEAYHEN